MGLAKRFRSYKKFINEFAKSITRYQILWNGLNILMKMELLYMSNFDTLHFSRPIFVQTSSVYGLPIRNESVNTSKLFHPFHHTD